MAGRQGRRVGTARRGQPGGDGPSPGGGQHVIADTNAIATRGDGRPLRRCSLRIRRPRTGRVTSPAHSPLRVRARGPRPRCTATALFLAFGGVPVEAPASSPACGRWLPRRSKAVPVPGPTAR